MKKMKKRKGFTIVELVIVIAVIAILATTLVPTFGNVIQNAKDSAAKQEAKNAFTSYMIEHPELSGSLFVYQTDGRYVAIKNGAPIGIYDTQAEACKSLGLAEDALFSDTGVDKLLISGDAPITPSDPTNPTNPSEPEEQASKQLFIAEQATKNYYLNLQGVETYSATSGSATWYITDYMPVDDTNSFEYTMLNSAGNAPYSAFLIQTRT